MTQQDTLAHARRELAETARAVLDETTGTHGVGLTVLLPDGPACYGANRFTLQVDQVQYSLMEGPCVTAARSRELVRLGGGGDAGQRWPRFVAEVAPLSLRDVVSVPLLAGSRVIGSLNLYSKRVDGLRSLDATQALRLAARVQPAVSNTRTLVVAATNARLLRGAARRDAAEPDAR